MTLATKNGSIIVKDGKLAENCGCCGDWYCCADVQCASDRLESVAVTISATDYIRNSRRLYSDTGVTLYETEVFGGSAISETHQLAKTSSTQYSVDARLGSAFMPKALGSEWVATIGTGAFACVLQLSGPLGQWSPQFGAYWSLAVRFDTLIYASSASGDYKTVQQMASTPDLAFSPNPYSPVSPSSYSRRHANQHFFDAAVSQCGDFSPLAPQARVAERPFVAWQPAGPSRGTQLVAVDLEQGSLSFSVAVEFS